MGRLHVLFEHAAGYALFTVSEFEEIGTFLPQVEQSVTDISRFNSLVKLTGFAPFKNALTALANMNAISEGIITEELTVFLDTSFPKKKKKNFLGIGDAKLGASITEALDIQCTHIGVVPEIIRGIRTHFHNLIKGFTEASSGIAQLGLGHSYSRAKVKFNVNRVDNMIIQSIALLDQLDKDINTFCMRIREWYSYHFPELVKIVPENHLYAKVTKHIKNRKEFNKDALPGLEEILMDSGKAQAVLDASKSSMGMDINVVDLINIEMFADRVISLIDYRKQLATYLHNKMTNVAPNLSNLIGDQVGARLISHAGSLTNLAKFPASTVQILGAEKALFRALKIRGNTPKYGLLFHSTFIGRAGTKNKGRISRFLANKCSLASRIDCFAEVPTGVFGDKLRQQVEDRLKFYETGDVPPKNIDVMQAALQQNEEVVKQILKAEKKKKKKKSKQPEQQNGNENTVAIKRKADEMNNTNGFINDEQPPKKKKKKNKDAIKKEQ